MGRLWRGEGSVIDELIERLESGDGLDRDLDSSIWLFTTPGATRSVRQVDHPDQPYMLDDTRDADGRLANAPAFTESLDEVVRWIQRELPG